MNSLEDPKIGADRLIARAYQRDGLPELIMGVTLILWAAFLFGVSMLPKVWPSFPIFLVGGGLGVLLLTPTLHRLQGWVRVHHLTPRFGYVRYKPRDRVPVWRVILLWLAVGCVMSAAGLIFRRWDKWFLLLAGPVYGAGRIGFGRDLGMPHFVVTGILSGLSGVALSLTNLPSAIAGAAWLGATGLVEFVSGCVVLFHLLVESPGAEIHNAD